MTGDNAKGANLDDIPSTSIVTVGLFKFSVSSGSGVGFPDIGLSELVLDKVSGLWLPMLVMATSWLCVSSNSDSDSESESESIWIVALSVIILVFIEDPVVTKAWCTVLRNVRPCI